MASGAAKRDKVILAYSGGLDTSVMVPWIGEKYNLDVVAFTVDLGQGEDIERIRQKALRTGAVDAVAMDARNLFVDCFVFPALMAGAIYEGKYPLATALGRPLIAKLMVDAAKRARGQGRGARLHRQGQRSGPLRRHLPDAGPGFEDHRPGARVEDEPRRVAGLRRQAQHPRGGDEGKPLQRRPEPVGPQLRGRRSGRSRGTSRRPTPSPGRPIPSRRRTSRSTSTSTSSRAGRSRSTARRWTACR